VGSLLLPPFLSLCHLLNHFLDSPFFFFFSYHPIYDDVVKYCFQPYYRGSRKKVPANKSLHPPQSFRYICKKATPRLFGKKATGNVLLTVGKIPCCFLREIHPRIVFWRNGPYQTQSLFNNKRIDSCKLYLGRFVAVQPTIVGSNAFFFH